ncbi:MAG: hypothetical protein JL50_08755 [Peptococcaceae bacterium BICA1-7]|nr:MAG: hypothetical protein JL50_08755 [Peptococcaceae bacterium BICA1-7]
MFLGTPVPLVPFLFSISGPLSAFSSCNSSGEIMTGWASSTTIHSSGSFHFWPPPRMSFPVLFQNAVPVYSPSSALMHISLIVLIPHNPPLGEGMLCPLSQSRIIFQDHFFRSQ